MAHHRPAGGVAALERCGEFSMRPDEPREICCDANCSRLRLNVDA